MATVRQLNDQVEILLNRSDGSDFKASSNPVVQLDGNRVYPVLTDPDQKQAVEHFGVLRTRVLNARTQSRVGALLVTSPQQQEGKSFTCLNLALSLAQMKSEPILLVDADLRVRGITHALGLREGFGLCDFLQDRARFEDCIRPTSVPQLYLASSGGVGEEDLPAALEGPRWPNFVRRAKQDFGLIVVDSVPVSAPIADFELLLHGCDGVLLVVFLHKTTREALEIASQKAQGKLLGVVVNNDQCEVSSNYYSYYMRKKPKKA
jgi:capsular exopolysaccharide synthesis family protein